MIDAQLLVEIEKLWYRVESLHMGVGDVLNLSIKIDDLTLDETIVNSKEEGLVWLSNQYQRLEAQIWGEA